MDRSSNTLHPAKRALLVGTSLAALASLVWLESGWAQAATLAEEDLAVDAAQWLEAEDEPIQAARPGPVIPLSAAPMAAPPPPAPDPDAVTVPTFEGMSFRQARKLASRDGVKLAVRDVWGERVAYADWRYMGDWRVRRQKTPAGTVIDEDERVRLSIRPPRAAMGY